jgi:Domain of unknown function DUF29
MPIETPTSLAALYTEDETAWLEDMARLLTERRHEELDYDHLSEFLLDMARRDRREVYSRLVVLLTHLLKWQYQPDKRGSSWRGTILEQRRELRLLLESGTLRNHAAFVLAEAYEEAREQAEAETELSLDTFPVECGQALDEVLSGALPNGNA